MFGAVARKIFGSSNERRIKAFQPRVDAINALEKDLIGLTDDPLSFASSSKAALRSTICWCPLLPPCAKPPSVCSASATSIRS